MSDFDEPKPAAKTRNPLFWICLIVIAAIVYLVFFSQRSSAPVPVQVNNEIIAAETVSGQIDRSLLVPPGMRARQAIEQFRSVDSAIDLNEVYAKAQQYQQEGSLADAHLMFFFAARKDHLDSIMVLGEMNDPTLFRADQSLLDQANPVQAYKWYSKAREMNHPAANEHLENLNQWAVTEAKFGNPYARLLLLNFR